jgi:uncharacterized membrane protein
VLAYLTLALAYARVTPAWQAPDEPAHYNYVAYLAERGQLPILQQGDYPDGQVPIGPETRPADVSAFRYESHQPPLFYALAALVFKFHPSVFALRALSALFGAALVPVAFWCAKRALPRRPWLWLGVAAFAAFIPMHLFVAGSVENDSLADLVISLLLLAVLARWYWPALGLLLGLAFLTKVTIYLPAALLVAMAIFLPRKEAWGVVKSRTRLTSAAGALALAMIVSSWWFVRNALIYGWTDVLVQGRQAEVAGSQTQTGAFGGAELVRFVATSFHSFWGQFGWMSIPLPERDYRGLIALTALAAAGWIAILAGCRTQAQSGAARPWLALGLTFTGVLAGDLAYNLKFVQPQGRYLFPALVPIAFFYVCGFAALFPRRVQPAAIAALSLALLAFSAYALQHDLAHAFA